MERSARVATRAAVELANSIGSDVHLVHVKVLLCSLPPYPDVLDWGDGEKTSSVPSVRLGSYSMSKPRRWRMLAGPLLGST